MKVLVIITTGLVEYGGLANAFMNYYNNMDLEGLTIDVVSSGQHDESMGRIIEENGGACYEIPAKQDDLKGYLCELKKILQRGYDVIDVHGNSATMILEMYMAKKAGIPNRMAHCLNSKTNHPFVHSLIRPVFNRLCNNKTACTQEAGVHLYGTDSFVVLRNTVPLDHYAFSEERRKTIRKLYQIRDDEILIGTVGKINTQKNQRFLLGVFKELVQKHDNLKFMIVGDGDLRADMEAGIKENGLTDYMILTGMLNDVVPYYSAFDIYVFPSLYEGESLALIEAKCSGIMGCASAPIRLTNNDNVQNILYLELDQEEWITQLDKQICACRSLDRHELSRGAIKILKESGLDCVDSAGKLRELYMRKDPK